MFRRVGALLLEGGRARLWAILAAVVAGGMFASQVSFLSTVLIDDAYISFSFSKNLALGKGLVYGHGLRVEAYSNFLWVVLVAIPLAVDQALSPLNASRVLMVPFLLVLGFALYDVVRRAAQSRLAAALALLLLSASTDLATAFLSGLETLPYSALLMLGFAVYLRAGEDRRAAAAVVPVFVAAALMRIDGMVPLAFVVGFEAARRVVRRQGSVRDFVSWALPGLLVYAIWFGWRWHYYGLPLPSTYYAKALIPVALPNNGILYVWGELRESRLWIVFGAIAFLLWRRRAELLPMILFVVGHLVYIVRVGGDWMPFGRFVLPVVPMAVALLVIAAAEIFRLARVRGRAVAAGLVVAYTGVAAAVVTGMDHRFLNTAGEDGKMGFLREWERHMADLRQAARLLKGAVPAGRRLATDYGGVMAYYTDASIIEMWGLGNATIARRGHTTAINAIYGRTCPECYPELDPEFFHVGSPLVRAEDAFATPADVRAAVWQSDTIGRHIDLVGGFAVGRARDPANDVAVYFLEKKTTGFRRTTRRTPDGVVVDYPFGGL